MPQRGELEAANEFSSISSKILPMKFGVPELWYIVEQSLKSFETEKQFGKLVPTLLGYAFNNCLVDISFTMGNYN